MLTGFYTMYAGQRNHLMRRLIGRTDTEIIDPRYIRTNVGLAALHKAGRFVYTSNDLFDRWVAWNIARRKDYDVLIGWSGMSLRAIRAAKQNGKITVLERGSSHILYQNSVLQEEYRKFGIEFTIDPRVMEKELKEYETCDFISIPSSFVKKTFVEQGIRPEKLIVNPYGAGRNFQLAKISRNDNKFRVLYLGGLSIRKGLTYLFEGLSRLPIPPDVLEVWFIGSISDEIKPQIERLRHPNWIFWGHVRQDELPQYIGQCDVGVQASLEDGFGMVVPQMLGCGVPVIVSTNTGALDIIREGENGFIVPIRSAEKIAEKIARLYHDPKQLAAMKINAAGSVQKGLTWEDYGQRYVSFLKNMS